MVDLSGRVSTLESSILFLTQDLLRKAYLSDLSQLSANWNQQLDITENKYIELNKDLQELQNLYSNLYLGDSAGFDDPGSTSYIAESFETISKNLKQYNSTYIYSGEYLSGVRYKLSSSNFILKRFFYNSSGVLQKIELTGFPVPSVSLNKNLLYSGSTLTGITYN
jgi:hypothetical protein